MVLRWSTKQHDNSAEEYLSRCTSVFCSPVTCALIFTRAWYAASRPSLRYVQRRAEKFLISDRRHRPREVRSH